MPIEAGRSNAPCHAGQTDSHRLTPAAFHTQPGLSSSRDRFVIDAFCLGLLSVFQQAI